MEPPPSLAVPQFVVDASVATKWYLNDEEFADEALKVLLDFQEERITLIAPEHIRYEVPSAIRNAIRTDRIDPEKAWEQVRLFLQLRIPVVRTSAVIELGLHASLEYGCSFYDGLYLALAAAGEVPLIHADGRLKRSIGGRFPYELWIADYGRP